MSKDIVPFVADKALLDLATTFANSDMVPVAYKGKPANVIVAWEAGHALGLSRLFALQNIAVINGKPSLYGDAPLAIVRSSGLLESIEELDAADALEAGEGRCTLKRKGCEPKTTRFTMAMAKAAGLLGKQGPWSTNPGRMLMFRARGFGIRDVFGDVLGGMGIGEEMDDWKPDLVVGNVEVMTPKSKSGSADTDALAAFNAGSKSRPTVTNTETTNKAPQKTAPVTATPTTSGKTYVCKGVEKKTGQPDAKGNIKTWYVVSLDDRDEGQVISASTFSDTLAGTASSMLGIMVTADLKTIEKNGKTYTNLIAIEPAPEVMAGESSPF